MRKIDDGYDPDAILRDFDDSVEDEEFEGEMEVLEDDPDLLYSTDDDD